MDKIRTNQQNKSLHKYYRLLSEEAQNKGVTVKMMIDALPDADVPVTPEILKEIWRIFQRKMLHKESTTQLTKKEIDIVFEPFSAYVAKNFDIAINFPSEEELYYKQEG